MNVVLNSNRPIKPVSSTTCLSAIGERTRAKSAIRVTTPLMRPLSTTNLTAHPFGASSTEPKDLRASLGPLRDFVKRSSKTQ